MIGKIRLGVARNLLARAAALTVALLCSGPAVAQDKPISLRMVVWDGNDSLPILRSVISEFELAHPNVHVDLENVDYNTYFQKLLAQYAGDAAPDVAMLDSGHYQAFAKRGALEPLDQYFNLHPGFDIHDYYPSAVSSYTYNHKLYILPRDVAPSGLIYFNKRAFDEAHIPYPDGTWTWDYKPRPELKEKDFIWVMQQLTKKNEEGRVVRWGFCPSWPSLFADTLAFSQGARYANDLENPDKVFFSDPRFARSYQYAADLSLKDHFIPSQTELNSQLQSNGVQLFASEKIAMYQCGIWDAQNIRTRNVPGSKDFFDWDITLAPGFRDGTRAGPAGGSGYSMMSTTRHPTESWLLLQWMAGPHGMTAMAKAGIAQPAIMKLAREYPWIPNKKSPLEEQYPQHRLVTDEAVQYSVISPTADFWAELTDLVNPRLDPIWSGDKSAASQFADMQRIAADRLSLIQGQRRLPDFNWPAGITVGLGLLLAIVAWVYLPDKRKKMGTGARAENRAGYFFLSPGLIGLALFSVGPMIFSLLMSFADWDIITTAKWRALGNYQEAFTLDPRVGKCFGITCSYALMSVPAGVIMSLALALLLNTKVRGIALYRTCFYLPALASAVASSLIWKKVFQQDGGLANSLIYGFNGKGNLLGIGGLLSSYAGKPGPVDWLGNEHLALKSFALMSIWGAGGGMIILLAGLQGVPQYYYEAATLDGAGPWRRFVHVTLPLIAPSLFFVTVTGVIGSFQSFTASFVISQGGPNDATRFFMYHLYEQAFRNLRMGYAAALAWLLFLVILILTLFQFRLSRNIYYEADLR